MPIDLNKAPAQACATLTSPSWRRASEGPPASTNGAAYRSASSSAPAWQGGRTERDALNRWREILPLLGIETRFLQSHHGPCPLCGGKDRYRFDDRDGTGSYLCNQCGAGTGIILLRKFHKWDHAKACAEVDKIIGDKKSIDRKKAQHHDAASLLSAPAEDRDDTLPVAYLAHRLSVSLDAVPTPSTRMVGIKALGYFDAPPTAPKGKPKWIGDWPCAAFETIAADGRVHAHRIYLAPGGAGKAELPPKPDGTPRDPKKSATKTDKDDRTAGRAVLWGDPERAPHVIVAEGIETGAAVALAFAAEVEIGKIAVAAAISAGGIKAFQPYAATKWVTVAADRDEATKPDGKPGERAGEKAARAFAAKYRERIAVAFALPG